MNVNIYTCKNILSFNNLVLVEEKMPRTNSRFYDYEFVVSGAISSVIRLSEAMKKRNDVRKFNAHEFGVNSNFKNMSWIKLERNI